MFQTLRQRNEWKFFGVLPKAGFRLAAGWWIAIARRSWCRLGKLVRSSSIAISIAITKRLTMRFVAAFLPLANVKNELTNAVGLNCYYDSTGNLTQRVYDSNGPKSYYYVYDDENELVEMRTDEYYMPSGSRFKMVWTYDGLGRVRVRTDYLASTSTRECRHSDSAD